MAEKEADLLYTFKNTSQKKMDRKILSMNYIYQKE